MPDSGKENGWTRYEVLVLKRLDDHSEGIQDIQALLTKVQVEIATLKVKCGVFGAIGASVPALAVVLFELFKK